jgi:broad specificity phosphatase PhoE
MTLLALLRHGQTEWSAQGRIQGRVDTELSEAGRLWLEQHRLPAEFGAWRSYSSPLQRCRQTCRCLALDRAMVEPRIIETHWGQWEGHTLAQLRAQQGQAMQDNEGLGLDFRPCGGESPREVLLRVRPWLAELAQGGSAALAVTHRGVIRVVLADALGWDMRGKAPVKLDWNALHVFSIDQHGRPRAERLNVALESRADLTSVGA